MTARKVVTRSGRGIRGFFPSHKMKMMIAWESLLERDAILKFEFSKNVRKFWAQPEKIHFYMNNEQKFCFPDFRLEDHEGNWTHIEVKPASKLKKPIIRNRLEFIRQHHEQINIPYQVLDETVLRQQPRLTNLLLLAYHLPSLNADLGHYRELLERLLILPPKTIGGAIAVLDDAQLVYQLLALGYYECDLDQPLNNDSLIFRVEGKKP